MYRNRTYFRGDVRQSSSAEWNHRQFSWLFAEAVSSLKWPGCGWESRRWLKSHRSSARLISMTQADSHNSCCTNLHNAQCLSWGHKVKQMAQMPPGCCHQLIGSRSNHFVVLVNGEILEEFRNMSQHVVTSQLRPAALPWKDGNGSTAKRNGQRPLPAAQVDNIRQWLLVDATQTAWHATHPESPKLTESVSRSHFETSVKSCGITPWHLE